MRVSLSWLRELVDLPETGARVAERLTMAGLEVEAISEAGRHLSGVVAAEVVAAAPHPKRADLKVVTVWDGTDRVDVVCGAPNVPDPPGRVVLARVGGSIAGTGVEARKLGGVASAGVLCSEVDLDIGCDASGLLILPPDSRPGTDVADLLSLRDTVLDVNVTANRPDCLGHLGMAREAGAIFGRPVALPRPAEARGDGVDPGPGVQVVVEDPAGCPRYGARIVRGLRIAASPWAIRYRLHLLGVRAISNVVDVTNLVLLLYSQPQHAFDLAALRGGRIVVRRARASEALRTLDGIRRALGPDDLLICDGEGPVAVAGVMGGEGSEVRPETTDVLIECAHFDPPSIRRTSKRLGLSSESSYRFERGTDRAGIPESLAWSAALMASLGGGTVCGPSIDVGGSGPGRPPVRLRPDRLARVVGRSYSDAEIARPLGRLGCRVDRTADGSYDVTPPGWRSDLGREIDLVEEVVRLCGLESVPTPVPLLAAGPRRRGAFERIRRVRELLVARGLSEAVNLVFADAESLRFFGAADAELVRLRNPLAADRDCLRSTLLVGLLANVRTAFSRRESSAALFETGRTFHARVPADASGLPREVWRLGAVLAGVRPGWLGTKPPPFDVHDAAALLGALSDAAFRLPWALRPAGGLPMLHPRTACGVEIGGSVAGICGELHPEAADRSGVPRGTLVLEIDLGAERFNERPVLASEPPRYPSVRRDVAAIFDAAVPAGEVLERIRALGPDILAEARVFDVYRGEPVPAGRKSMAFSLVYRAPDRTLTDAEVDAAHGRILDGLAAGYQVTIRM